MGRGDLLVRIPLLGRLALGEETSPSSDLFRRRGGGRGALNNLIYDPQHLTVWS